MKNLKKAIIYSAIIFFIILLQAIVGNMNENKNIRKPAVSGLFYPENNNILLSQFDNYLKNTEIDYNGETINALIVPHAGYLYSGKTAMKAYKLLYMDLLLREEDSFKIIILSPNHTEYTDKVVIPDYEYFRTPLGDIKTNSTKINAKIDNTPHLKEHAIEVQLPFLQYVFKKADKKFTIVPLIVGDITKEEIKNLAKELNKELDKNTIVIVSSDLSHYKSKKEANLIDSTTIDNILNKKTEATLDACGRNPILVLQELAKIQGWDNKLLEYTTSGDILKDNKSVVGYASITYFKNEKHLLTRLAKRSIQNVFDSRKDNFKDLETSIPKEYLEKKGNFVTLTINNGLRGCIGNITSTKSVFDGIIANSKFAAFQDPRFNELTELEFYKVDIEISILSTPKNCSLEEIEKGDGVILKQGFLNSVYLPQVWEQLPNKEKFLNSLCEKAELDKNCYKKKETKFQKFSVEII